jgi:lysophospholipase L1-like esterase
MNVYLTIPSSQTLRLKLSFMTRLRHLPVLSPCLPLLGLLGLCLTLTACHDSKSPTEPTPPPATNEVFYTAVGASDGIGYGGSAPCVPFTDCPNGTGYVQTVARRLKDTGKVVTLMNLSIPGAVLSPGIESIAQTIGRGVPGNFIDREAPFVPRNTTLVTLFAGGNDINTIAEAVVRGQGGTDPNAYVTTQIKNFGSDLKSLIGKIRERAPGTRIIALNLPNFAGLPLAANITPESKRILQQIAVGFSAQVNALTSNSVVVVDLMCDARSYQAGNYSSDGFHPNDRGYAYITELLLPVATTGSGPSPLSSCPQMTMF